MIEKLMCEMIKYYSGDPKRIQHFTKVYAYASLLGKMEGLSETTQQTLEIAAIVHDIGIKAAEEKYGYNNGKLQEQEGPRLAETMLEGLSVEQTQLERVCYLVGHHHTYTNIDGIDYQLLVEADFLVNLFEDSADTKAAETVRERIFTTASGKKILTEMFGLSKETF